ncbi:MAG: TetR family transcriptional regulator [Nitrospirota bacterium]|nr:TetR family transcriptional regulator [Nitrospirota bacterium]
MKVKKPKTRQKDTRQLILDSAERLFAREGFHVTSLRAITGAAGVNLAAVNYHFGSKEALLEAVFERRLIPLNQVRRDKLEQIRDEAVEKGKRPSTKKVLQAFIEPTLRFRDSESGAKDLIALVGRSFTDPDDTVRKIFFRLIGPIFQLLFETLRDALPELPENLLYWRLHFALGALAHTMHISGCDKFLPVGFSDGCGTESLLSMLIPFVTAGMEAS